ncbi:MAG: phosphoglucosamine mutase [Flavobacteriaceae bacterium]|nr:phosphoglucosamine mutase [Flavobacteriaceae bacterium]
MSLIKSISGIRGTIGGKPGDSLTPIDIVKFTSAFGDWISKHSDTKKMVVGRDARLSGEMVNSLVCGTLVGLGFEVIDLGFSTTPTVEMAVVREKAAGGIILTASHNPKQWNALKLLNSDGEFISGEAGEEVLRLAEAQTTVFAEVDKLGKIVHKSSYEQHHIDEILALALVDVKAIKAKNYRILVDAVNSTGGLFVPKLLYALGVKEVVEVNCEPTGKFAHNPEPLPENLGSVAADVKHHKCDLGIVVDPDVDRLALINEDGSFFGEEYTLVAVADYILKSLPEAERKKATTVSNLSSTRALRDVTEKHGGTYHTAAVGEVNVVTKMKEVNAIIGGEGNGGVIFPELHYGRDALVGIALFLTHLAKFGNLPSILRSSYPNYFISKNKIDLSPETDIDNLLLRMKEKYAKQPLNTVDGLKIEFDKEWVHLRKSNTEPIIRIYSESESEATANHLANKIISDIKAILKG